MLDVIYVVIAVLVIIGCFCSIITWEIKEEREYRKWKKSNNNPK